MANQEHLDILKQGRDVWNKWRKDHPEIRPDLSDCNLTQFNNANLCNTLQLHFLSPALMVLKKEKKTLESFSYPAFYSIGCHLGAVEVQLLSPHQLFQ